MKTKNYIAFVDLVGVSNMARTDNEAYSHCLEVFLRSIQNRSSILKESGKIYFFSDCAYFESSNIVTIIKFFREIRRDLMRFGYFFKGSLGIGKLNAKTFTETNDTVQGHYFGNDIIKVYGAHDALKGIGVNVLDTKDLSLVQRKHLINSCYLKHTNSKRAITFTDIKFHPDEITNENLSVVLSKMFESYSKSKRIARYYLSFIISMIQSTDFSKISVKDNKIQPPPIYKFVSSGSIDSHFGDLSGGEYIYYALLNKLWSDDCDSFDMCNDILKKMINKKRILKVIEYVPACIFSQENKKAFLQKLGYNKIMI